MYPTWKDWDLTYTRKGSFKKAVYRATRILAAFAAILGFLQLKGRIQVKELKDLLKECVRFVLFGGAGLLQVAGSKV